MGTRDIYVDSPDVRVRAFRFAKSFIPSSRSIPGLGKRQSSEALREDEALPFQDAPFTPGRRVPRALLGGCAADRVVRRVCPSHAEENER